MTTTKRRLKQSRRWIGCRKQDVRSIRLRCKYGISIHEMEFMRRVQNNRCACCLRVFTKTPNVDHNHATGHVRALLCGNCNTGLGLFGDSPQRLLQAIAYLSSFDHPDQFEPH